MESQQGKKVHDKEKKRKGYLATVWRKKGEDEGRIGKVVKD